jgi:23S rRNA pseudouridine1911/1915/1917 synthase
VDFGAGWQIHPRVTLLYLDSALAVVNKGAELISVPAPNAVLSALSILQDFLEGRLKVAGHGFSNRTLPPAYRRLSLLPVHRLDQYTSGVFCMACNPHARENLVQQVRSHTMRREYVAFASGKSPTPSGTWRQWMELSDDQMRQRIVPKPRAGASQSKVMEAVTHFEVHEEYQLPGIGGFVTKLGLRLETGRKHQIRVQAASAGLPLIGDRTYNPEYQSSRAQPPLIDFSRQALHAERLTLEHPEIPGKLMSWTAPLPRDLRQLEAKLTSHRR